MAEGSGLSAMLNYDAVPKLPSLPTYIQQTVIPDATYRNWNAYSGKTFFGEGVNVAEAFMVLPDPQTNGGLLFSVNETAAPDVLSILKQSGLGNFTEPIGRFVKKEEKTVRVEK
jgi:selenide,water dikinase